MLDVNDFSKKQILVYCPAKGDKISYKNDNMIIKDGDGNTKYQISCYRIFMLMVIGDCSFTTGIIRRARKFGFSICFMTYSFRFYAKLNAGLEGNFILHQKQYGYEGIEIAQILVRNKIANQKRALERIRNKTEYIKEGIRYLKEYESFLYENKLLDKAELMGIEGNASKVYFPRIFDSLPWKSRKPRIKFDFLNSLLDIGYTLLFNFIDALLQIYDFDVYKGVFHTNFYMRKSLVCDLMEPFRPIIDERVRKGYRLSQFKKEDFVEIKGQWQLEYKKNAEYVGIFMGDILETKEVIFKYIREYYRAFMKGKDYMCYPFVLLHSDSLLTLSEYEKEQFGQAKRDVYIREEGDLNDSYQL